ncbi:Asp23/Gls24 family envelope stress response protein [Pseudonocardia sp. KRD291]|uniref:Asp23/Gls24 family envelope stress response protein n=1 Tax=Pseudonocardia sp. KRD291 TaxID=2792007 RepID=UPI001C49E3F9|nr:Asp23/Gls24 family envelope stress response protein [Pseudonocardia sp. KRD291]MBW0102891.1 Asp23/Gls24 family envelope stress response protein [Pseudonocardia sp. KRD291]
MSTTDGPRDDPRDDGDAELACGRSLDAVIEQVSAGHAAERDAHQRGCVHCQAALGEYERLWTPLRELAAEKVTAPEGTIDEALARIRGAIAEPDYAVLTSVDGVTRVAARVVVVAARHTAEAVPGVRVALSKNLTGRATDSEVAAGVAGSSAAIEITLAADYGQRLHQLGDEVRRSVTERVRRLTDIEPVEVTVIIDDVLG